MLPNKFCTVSFQLNNLVERCQTCSARSHYQHNSFLAHCKVSTILECMRMMPSGPYFARSRKFQDFQTKNVDLENLFENLLRKQIQKSCWIFTKNVNLGEFLDSCYIKKLDIVVLNGLADMGHVQWASHLQARRNELAYYGVGLFLQPLGP